MTNTSSNAMFIFDIAHDIKQLLHGDGYISADCASKDVIKAATDNIYLKRLLLDYFQPLSLNRRVISNGCLLGESYQKFRQLCAQKNAFGLDDFIDFRNDLKSKFKDYSFDKIILDAARIDPETLHSSDNLVEYKPILFDDYHYGHATENQRAVGNGWVGSFSVDAHRKEAVIYEIKKKLAMNARSGYLSIANGKIQGYRFLLDMLTNKSASLIFCKSGKDRTAVVVQEAINIAQVEYQLLTPSSAGSEKIYFVKCAGASLAKGGSDHFFGKIKQINQTIDEVSGAHNVDYHVRSARALTGFYGLYALDWLLPVWALNYFSKDKGCGVKVRRHIHHYNKVMDEKIKFKGSPVARLWSWVYYHVKSRRSFDCNGYSTDTLAALLKTNLSGAGAESVLPGTLKQAGIMTDHAQSHKEGSINNPGKSLGLSLGLSLFGKKRGMPKESGDHFCHFSCSGNQLRYVKAMW